jgi:hypothetical protein
MNTYLIALRLIHIFAGAYWVGAAIIQVVFIARAAKASTPESGKFMQALMGRYHFPISLGIASYLTVGAGILLYWRNSGGLQLAWITSGVGLGYTIGAAAAFVSFFLGLLVFAPTSRKLAAVSAAIGPTGPTPDQLAELGRLNARMDAAGKLDVIVLVIALLAMATARYWFF